MYKTPALEDLLAMIQPDQVNNNFKGQWPRGFKGYW